MLFRFEHLKEVAVPFNQLFFPSLGVATLVLSASTLAQTATTAATTASTGTRYGTFGINLTGADKAVKPSDDFWTYANGSWNKRTAIAADRTSAGGSVVLADQAEQ